jgi:hypothetical protein
MIYYNDFKKNNNHYSKKLFLKSCIFNYILTLQKIIMLNLRFKPFLRAWNLIININSNIINNNLQIGNYKSNNI